MFKVSQFGITMLSHYNGKFVNCAVRVGEARSNFGSERSLPFNLVERKDLMSI